MEETEPQNLQLNVTNSLTVLSGTCEANAIRLQEPIFNVQEIKHIEEKVKLTTTESNNLNSEKPFTCDVCSKSFCHKSTITKHMRIHSNDNPLKCEICSKSFSQKYDLSKHVRIHNEEKPYKCNFCSKSYSAKFNLLKHSQVHKSN